MSNYLPKILVTGGNGQIASALRSHAGAKEFEIIFCTHHDMDITNPDAIKKVFAQHQPNFIINTAAYTAVDKAESEHEQAMAINHLGALQLAIACAEYQIPLIQLSTDYIFDGTQTHAYIESDLANPINMYGESKWLGEEAVRQQLSEHIILRVSGVFSEFGTNFLKSILRLAKEKEELRIVADQTTCPTYAGAIAGLLYSLVKKPPIWGTYHYCSTKPLSWYDFAIAIINEAKKHTAISVKNIVAIPTADYLTPAKRPLNAILNCSKIQTQFNLPHTNCVDELPRLISLLTQETKA
jgi:dTDP-4-dehydrorhamnose reductase